MICNDNFRKRTFFTYINNPVLYLFHTRNLVKLDGWYLHDGMENQGKLIKNFQILKKKLRTIHSPYLCFMKGLKNKQQIILKEILYIFNYNYFFWKYLNLSLIISIIRKNFHNFSKVPIRTQKYPKVPKCTQMYPNIYPHPFFFN